jgi:hypothetical protein
MNSSASGCSQVILNEFEDILTEFKFDGRAILT